MTWESETAAGDPATSLWDAAKGNDSGGASAWTNVEFPGWNTSAPDKEVLIEPSKHANSPDIPAAGAGTGVTCHNCGILGHFSRDCTEPRKFPDCRNCNQNGHTAEECQNAFSGICRICSTQGHRAMDCPNKAVEFCKNCGEEGHRVLQCSNNRVRNDLGLIRDVTPEDAWNKLRRASDEKDLDDFRTAFWEYMKATPESSYSDMETAFRSHKFAYYLIAREKEISDTHEIMNYQGKLGMKYHLQFHSSPTPTRIRQSQGWPASAEENQVRLLEAGEVVDKMVPKCSNCNELGHVAKHCKAEREERERTQIKCVICQEIGHRARDCTQPRVDRNACRNCKQSGHKATDCTEPRSAEGVECKRCNEVGHFAKDCPSGGNRTCRNCDAEDHVVKDCPEPRNPARMTCRNCEKTGHVSRDCPEPKDWSKVKCNNCQEFGHTIHRCPKAKEGPAGGEFPTASGGGFEGTSGDFGTTSVDTTNDWGTIPAATDNVQIW